MSGTRYLLVDAHNVIHATAKLRDALKHNQDSARDLLAEMVAPIHDAEGVRVAVVLDSKNDTLQVEHPYGKKSFEYLYAPASLTADGVIERIVRRVGDSSKVTVASNDNMIREAGRAAGAIVLRPEELFAWAAACERRLEQDAMRRNAANAEQFKNGIEL
jgi:predicted RNA-binding protein with PIN domain